MPIPKPNRNNFDDSNNNQVDQSQNQPINNNFSLPDTDLDDNNFNYDQNGRLINEFDQDNSGDDNVKEINFDYSDDNNGKTNNQPVFDMPSNQEPYQQTNPNLNNNQNVSSFAPTNRNNNQPQSNNNQPQIPQNSGNQNNNQQSSKQPAVPSVNENNSQDTFIDEKNKKLKPFGRKKKIKVEELDSRKDMRKRTKIVQYIIILLLALTTLLGLYRVIVPPKTLSVADVQGIVDAQTGNTGFPLQRGQGFATDFMSAFLQTDSKNANAVQALGYFYSGGKLQANDSPIRNFSNIKQNVLYGPTVYQSTALTEYSANYVVGAYVIASNPDGSAIQPTSAPTANPTTGATDSSSTSPSTSTGASAKWSFFSVNVYYDSKNNSFAIAPESPSVVAPVNVGNVGDIPNEAKIGTGSGDDALNSNIKGVVYGFMKAYQTSTNTEHTDLDQYVIPNAPSDLLTGLGGRFTIDGGTDNIKYNSYTTADPNVVKVQVIVNWREGSNSNASLTYKSTYIMTLQKQSNGKYLVMKFAPQLYFQQ